mgnify:FL=1
MENIGSIIGLSLLLIWMIVSVVLTLKTLWKDGKDLEKEDVECHITKIIENK